MDIASPVTHSALDFFEKPSVLINYEGSYDQEVFTRVGCRGPQLDFSYHGRGKKLDWLESYSFECKSWNLYRGWQNSRQGQWARIVFSNNTLHTLFSHVELYSNGKLISPSSNCYLHSAFIETELTADTEGKKTWAKCQGYNYLAQTKEQDQAFNRLYADLDRKKECTAELYGALHIDFLECEKLLIPGVALHLRLFRSPNNTQLLLKRTDEAKALDGKVQSVIEKSSLFVRKVVVTDSVKLSFEKALLKCCAIYPYIESLNKSFIIQAAQNCFIKENVFGTEPIRRLTLLHGQKLPLLQYTLESFTLLIPKIRCSEGWNSTR